MGFAAALFAFVTGAILAFWGWLGTPVEMPQAPLGAGEKLTCVSYAPFRGDQNPFGADIPIDPHQIDEDLAQLKAITDCVRTYSVDHGLDQIPEIAKRHGMKVIQGLWISNLPDLTRKQIDTTVALAKRYPDVIQAIVVGNEVLLRGEMSAPELARTIREVKAQVSMPVTYADVWEFWLRYREIAGAVDFITIHILPYWEDDPLAVPLAAPHVEAIRKQIVDAFPGKEVLVGEFGWPSAGRMREGALPSPANQARVLQEVVALAKRQNYRLNVIEAYDQPWKRQLEGAVGGHWGLYDAYRRQAKFTWGSAVSNHPDWRWRAGGGIVLAALVFGAALLAGRKNAPASKVAWLGVAANATVAGALIGWTLEKVPVESLTLGDWTRSLAWTAVAILAPIAGAVALVSGITIPSFAQVIGRERVADRRSLVLGALLVATTVLAVEAALGLVFDPRYRDFPFPAITGAAVPFLLMARWPRWRKLQPGAETVAAATLALCAVYVLFNETLANWQSVWFCAAAAALAFSLASATQVPARDAPSS
jgi:exo-beta-1,3-glucanase (GH17 family)